jgi:hypothetical protein
VGRRANPPPPPLASLLHVRERALVGVGVVHGPRAAMSHGRSVVREAPKQRACLVHLGLQPRAARSSLLAWCGRLARSRLAVPCGQRAVCAADGCCDVAPALLWLAVECRRRLPCCGYWLQVLSVGVLDHAGGTADPTQSASLQAAPAQSLGACCLSCQACAMWSSRYLAARCSGYRNAMPAARAICVIDSRADKPPRRKRL